MSTKNDSLVTRGLVALTTIFVFVIIFLLISLNKVSSTGTQPTADASVVEGTQYIDLTAKGGYFPRNLTAKANTDTILRVKTANTFDCSSALVIPSLNYRRNLPQTGTTEIKIPPQSKDSEIRGTCSMGMYRFSIKFI